jgi:hypothetical protein
LTTYRVGIVTKIVSGIVISIALLAEVFRLRAGYLGSKFEKVPSLAAFLLLSLFPALPLSLMVAVFPFDPLPVEKAIGPPLAMFVIAELYLGYKAARSLIRRQTALFYQMCHEQREKREAGEKVEELGSAPNEAWYAGLLGAPPPRRLVD